MSQVCRVCSHPHRTEIDTALVRGELLPALGALWGVSLSSLKRHKATHLPAELARAQDAQEVADADALLGMVKSLQARSLRLLDRAERKGHLVAALGAIRETRGCIELMAKLLGQIDERPQVNISISAEWISIRLAILAALAPYPEARNAVAAALLEVEPA